MNFSGTKIQAKTKYLVTRKEVKTVFDFLSIHNLSVAILVVLNLLSLPILIFNIDMIVESSS